jgi:PucR family transcriptional regulator, purine catabolism regulatory protein
MPFLTVADVLRLPVLVAGLPRVLAGQDQLTRPVRWVHVTELLDPASFLEGGELVLTTGMPQPRDPASLRGYVDQLADVGAAGLVVELGRRYQKAPAELVSACRERDLPLIVLSRGVRFIEVTQTVHALILDAQGELLRRSQQVHEAFTALTLRRAEPAELVATAAELAGRPVVLENLVHHAVLVATPSPDGQVLEAWPRRSRATPTPDGVGTSGPEEWLVAPSSWTGSAGGGW